MNRRDFLTLLAAAPASALADGTRPADARHLILIELKGGNDGLNTVVPYRDAVYRKLRPNLALAAEQCLPLDDTRALHPELSSLIPVWQRGELAIVEGLGYDNPNRSHFRSIDIWHSASDSDEKSSTGWLSTSLHDPLNPVDAVVFGNRPAPIAGGDARYVAFDSLDAYIATHSRLTTPRGQATNTLLRALGDTNALGEHYRKSLAEHPLPSTNVRFAGSKFGRWLGDTARLLKSGMAPPLIKLHLSGFDTHADQLERHSALLRQFSEGMAALRTELIDAGLWDKVLIMTYSEFGRRLSENASQGSDHGTAAPHFLIGGRVKGGLYGITPSLQHLQADDLVHTVDYRALYRTVLQHWWHLPVQPGIRNRFEAIDCLRT